MDLLNDLNMQSRHMSGWRRGRRQSLWGSFLKLDKLALFEPHGVRIREFALLSFFMGLRFPSVRIGGEKSSLRVFKAVKVFFLTASR